MSSVAQWICFCLSPNISSFFGMYHLLKLLQIMASYIPNCWIDKKMSLHVMTFHQALSYNILNLCLLATNVLHASSWVICHWSWDLYAQILLMPSSVLLGLHIVSSSLLALILAQSYCSFQLLHLHLNVL